MFRVVQGPIDADAVREAVEGPDRGAVVVFHGTVRDRTKGRRVTHLVYEAYEPMAVARMREIASEVAARHGASAIACVHRTGRLEPGEAAMVLAVSSPHRAAALAAVEAYVSRLKQEVPVWKKEFFEDGAVWVGSPEDPQAERAARAEGGR